jgi:hypothetical protein
MVFVTHDETLSLLTNSATNANFSERHETPEVNEMNERRFPVIAV